MRVGPSLEPASLVLQPLDDEAVRLLVGDELALDLRPTRASERSVRGDRIDECQTVLLTRGVVIRPWLQAFHWRTKTYSPEYIKVQVATAKEKGGIGFLFWNAANDYSKPFTAMPEMRAADLKEAPNGKPKFFRGDELPGTTVKASLSPTVVPAPAPAEPGSH